MNARLGISLALGLTACTESTTVHPNRICGFLSEPRPCVGLAVIPGWTGLLKGDTVRVFSRSDSGYSADVTWSIAGNGVLVAGSGLEHPPLGESASRSILVRGLTIGATTVTAANASAKRTAALTLTVADSSEVTRIIFFSYASNPSSNGYSAATTTMRVGDSIQVNVTIYDAANRLYGVAPAWATSDSTIATFGSRPSTNGRQVWVRGHKPGAVDIITSFASARGTLPITVTTAGSGGGK